MKDPNQGPPTPGSVYAGGPSPDVLNSLWTEVFDRMHTVASSLEFETAYEISLRPDPDQIKVWREQHAANLTPETQAFLYFNEDIKRSEPEQVETDAERIAEELALEYRLVERLKHEREVSEQELPSKEPGYSEPPPKEIWDEACDRMCAAASNREATNALLVTTYGGPEQVMAWREQNADSLTPETQFFLRISEATKRSAAHDGGRET